MAVETKVILLEDDKTLISAMSAFLTKEGVEVFSSSRPEEVIELLEQHRVTTLFVDCLLPSENGVDFVRNLRVQYPKDMLDIVLMSGVFTDPSFVRESIRDTDALVFLKKPFSNDEVLRHIKRPAPAEESPHPRKLLYRLFNKPQATGREKRKAIEALEEIHGFDLPLIYSLLVEAKLSGHLNIVSEGGDVSGISFSQGLIVGVDIVDKETILGKLLIESGYLLPEDLEESLKDKSTKRIGEKLIHSNLLSPHGFNIVLSNQMSIRLSRTIVDQAVRVNFVPAEVELTTPHVDSQLFQKFLHDWIASKLTIDWFRAHFMQWSHAHLVKAPLFNEKKSALEMPLISRMEGLLEVVTSGKTLGEILESKTFSEETLYKSLHFMLTRGLLTFEEELALKPEDRIKLMRTIMQQFAGRNRLEIFDRMARMTSASESNPENVYKEFMTLLGDETDAEDKEIHNLYQQLKQIGRGAADFARSGGREKMKEELMKGDVELKLKASSYFEEAKLCLQKAQYKEALALIQKAGHMDPKLDRLHLYLAWAKLGPIESAKNKKALLNEIDLDLLQIAPEHKFDSLYNYVMGLTAKARGDYAGARKALEKAIAMDNSMIMARRELTVISSRTAAKKDVFDADLKTVIGNLFTKKR